MPNTAVRLITLIMLLQRRPNQKASDLADELDVSIRTVHRYFDMLEEMGIPIYSERGPNGGFSLVRGYKMPPLILTPEESVAIYLGTSLVEEMWGALYKRHAQSALAKLDNLLPEEQRNEIAWAQRSLFATGMHRSDLSSLVPVLDKVRRSAREHRRIQMKYRSKEDVKITAREVDVYALLYRWGWWYLIGFCHKRQAIRTFRVDRVIELKLLNINFELPADFNLNNYLSNEPYSQPGTLVRMVFDPSAVRIVHENRFFWKKIEQLENGCIEVSFESISDEWAVRLALGYGSIVQIIDPPHIQMAVLREIEKTKRRYL
jgi:predicted DNA-binding transcriptional regulator YafY